MLQEKICLASDNWSPAHPSILQAVMEANEGCAPSYGADPWSVTAQVAIQEAFLRPCKVFFVPSGTGANIFALKVACMRHESILCSHMAHIHYQESGAAESIIGCKLLTVAAEDGKMTPLAIRKQLQRERAFGKHSTKPRILSITQPTEIGTLYSLVELKALVELCREEGLLLHMDGSRLYNAAVALNASLHEICAGIDILSLGGTKNGLLGAEAVVIFNPELFDGSDHLQKQTLQLTSKMRFLSAQYIPFFQQGLWHTLAAHANQKAQEIGAIIKAIPNLNLSCAIETNQIFFTAPAHWIPQIQAHFHCYLWEAEKHEMRFITSWNTSEEDVQAVKSSLAAIAKAVASNAILLS